MGFCTKKKHQPLFDKGKVEKHKWLGIKDSRKMSAVPENDNILHNIITMKATIGFFSFSFFIIIFDFWSTENTT